MAEKVSRIDLYLHQSLGETYVNTDEEAELLNKFLTLYSEAKGAHDGDQYCNPTDVENWRKAYNGVLNALDQDGNVSKRKSRQLKKVCYEIIESMIDNSIPMPKLQPRYKTDLPLVNITENYLKFETDTILTKYLNDASERSTYIDGTCWYKVWWDSLDNTHERSGNVKIDIRTVEQIIPQPGVYDYRKLEYIFEIQQVSISRLYDLYGRVIQPTDGTTNVVEVISCYYLNSDRIVGLFMWAKHSNQVICNERDWQIRKLRKCTNCGSVVPNADVCPVCGHKHFKYENADKEILDQDLYEVYNPYEVGDTNRPVQPEQIEAQVFLEKGTEIPFYHVRQLPFVPRPAISAQNSIYGISEVKILLESQDAINKILTKAVDKTLKSGAVVTKPEKLKLSDKDDTFKILGVRTAEEAQMVNTKQVVADTTQDIVLSNMLYDSGKAASGITDSFQGQKDTTASSGKAKQFAAAQSAGRIESLRVMKAAAFSGVYELILKYLLAFSDEDRKFVRVLPGGSKKEECWNKYMFLSKDKYGQVYYRDDLSFSSDPASTLSQSRVQMWQEAQQQFVQGMFGNPADPRSMKLFWNVMDSLQYPLANVALAGIEESEQHLPFEVEQAIMSNPELQQLIMMALQNTKSGSGGARPNSGPAGNGNTHAGNVAKTNEKNRMSNQQQPFSAQTASASGGM